ncbi:MAG: insulinase family protein [Betaproteobacteria bacterium]|nr:insulinase family protein [Betaproteobacteria bacterium]
MIERWLAPGMLCLAIALFSPHAQAQSTPVGELTLDNGMRVIVKTDRRAPVVVSMVWYQAGSVDEVNGTTGVAHVLEHMLFKGTKSRPAGDFSKIVAAAGGRDNAFTSRDYTGYFQTIQKSQLPLMLSLEADRMVNALISPEEFAKEIKVVMEERRWRTDDRPRSLVYEQLMAAALIAHPYRTPVVGWMSDLQNMSAADARAFYEQWYGPNNATLVVVGDVSHDEVFELARRHFGPLKPRALPPRKPQDEPPQMGVRRITVKAPAEQPYFIMAYRAPRLIDAQNDWEPYALDMLASVLSGNAAARFSRELVRGTQIASSVGASYDGVGRGPAFFYLWGVPTTGKTLAELEQAVRREVQKIIDEGVAEDELKRVKAQVTAARVYERDSMFFQARQIGSLAMAGFAPRAIDVMNERFNAVTAEQVREVAKKYLIDDALTVAYLDPQPVGERKPAAPPPGVRHGN